MEQYKASQQEEMFDELLKNCSWSYKTLSTSKRLPKEKLKAQRTIKSRALQNDAQNENESNASDKDSPQVNDIESFKEDQTVNDKLRDKTKYSSMETEDELEIVPKMTSTPYPRKHLNAKHPRKLSTEMTSSSDNDEVYQTRFSVGIRDIFNQEERNRHHESSVKHVEHSKDKCIEDFKANTSPIIIQARAYDNNAVTTLSCNTESHPKSTLKMNHLENYMEKFESKDTLNAESSYYDTVFSNSKNQYSLKKHKEISHNRPEQNHQNEILNELMNKITAISDGSAGRGYQDSEKTQDDSFVQDFLNGSFDISLYKTDSKTSKRNVDANKIPLGKCKLKTSTDTSNKRSQKKQLSTNTKTLRSSRSRGVAKTMNKVPLKVKDSNGMQEKQKMGNAKARKRKTKKKNEEDEVSYDILSKSSLLKRPRKNKRNSSLVASKKIKEIEQLEESFEKQEEICLDSETDELNLLEFANIENEALNYNFGSENNNYSNKTKNAKNNANICNYKFKDNPNSEEMSSNESLHLFSARQTEENLWPPKYKTDDMINTFFENNRSRNYLKANNKKIEQKHSSYQNMLPYYPQKIEKSSKNPYCGSVKSKIGIQYSEIKQDEIFHKNKSNPPRNYEIQSVMSYNGPITRCKKRTWDFIEKELLGDLDDSSNNNVYDSSFKKPKLVREQSNKVLDLYASTNGRQIIKATTGNMYDKKYRFNTGKNDFKLGYTNVTSNYSLVPSSAFTKEIVTSYSKTVSVVEKAIAAMNKCTRKFITPEENINESEQNESIYEIEAESDFSNASPDALFQSNATFVSKKNKGYYKNEIVGYMKKSLRKEKSNSADKNYFQNFANDEQFRNINVLRKCDVETDSKPKHQSNNEMNYALVLPSEEKCNPWNKLMLDLNLNQDKEHKSEWKTFNLQDTKELHGKALTSKKNLNKPEDKNQNREQKRSYFEAFNDNMNNQYVQKKRYNRNDHGNLERIDSDRLFVGSFKLSNIPNSERVIHNTQTEWKLLTNDKVETQFRNEMLRANLSQPERKIVGVDVAKIKRSIKSPNFNLRRENRGKLELVKPLTKNSSITNNFKETMTSKQNKVRVVKKDQAEHKKICIEKYKKHLQKKLEESPTSRNDMNDHEITFTKTKKNPVNKTKNQKKRRILIAEEDEEECQYLKNRTDENLPGRNNVVKNNYAITSTETQKTGKKTGNQKIKLLTTEEDMEENLNKSKNVDERFNEITATEAKKTEERVSKDEIVSQRLWHTINENDVFSLSSDSESDSAISNKEVTGLFQELFDES